MDIANERETGGDCKTRKVDVLLKPDGTANGDKTAESAMQEAEQNLYAACGKLGNMSEAFFGKMHPFSPVGGRFYCENALEAVGQDIPLCFFT